MRQPSAARSARASNGYAALALGAALVLAWLGCAGVGIAPSDPRLHDWQKRASELRGLEFERRVRLVWLATADVPGVLRGELLAQASPEELARYRDGYAALGALAYDVDLFAAQLALHEQAIAGLYSPRSRTLYVVESVQDHRGGTGAEAIVVHELVHALQHQHFPDTIQILLGLRHNDDVSSALGSALEGDATLAMQAPGGGSTAGNLAGAARVRADLLADLERPDGMGAGAPRLLRMALIAPYAHGVALAATRYAEAGTAGLDALLRDPPLSMREVAMSAEGRAVEMVALPLAELPARAPGCALGEHNSAGVLTLRVILEGAEPEPGLSNLLRAWRGDRYVQLACGEPGWELVWLTRWRTHDAARRFAERYRKLAPGIAAAAPLAGPAEVYVRDTSALALTPGVRGLADWLFETSEVRSYESFSAWRADGCFPETPCPKAVLRGGR